MSLDDWHLVFVSVCLMLVLAAAAPVGVALLPRREESFFAFAASFLRARSGRYGLARGIHFRQSLSDFSKPPG